jgi:hypothetical protein
MIQKFTRRRALQAGAALVAAAALPALPALAAEPDDVAGHVMATLEPPVVALAARPTVDLAALSAEEWDTAGLFCVFFGAGLSNEAVAATLWRYRAPEDVDVEDALALYRVCDGEAIVGRRFHELPVERKAAGLLLGLGIVQGLEPREFADLHAGLRPRRVRIGLEPSTAA